MTLLTCSVHSVAMLCFLPIHACLYVAGLLPFAIFVDESAAKLVSDTEGGFDGVLLTGRAKISS